jgi:hypothetical protein
MSDNTDQTKGKPETREQRRYRERTNLEAQSVIKTGACTAKERT